MVCVQILVGFGSNSNECLEDCLENDYDSKTKLSIIFSMLHFFETKIIKRKSLTCLRDWAARVLKSLMGFSNTSNNRQSAKNAKNDKNIMQASIPIKKKID